MVASAVTPLESVTVKFRDVVPGVVGAPDKTPVLVLNVIPAGVDANDHVYGWAGGENGMPPNP